MRLRVARRGARPGRGSGDGETLAVLGYKPIGYTDPEAALMALRAEPGARRPADRREPALRPPGPRLRPPRRPDREPSDRALALGGRYGPAGGSLGDPDRRCRAPTLAIERAGAHVAAPPGVRHAGRIAPARGRRGARRFAREASASWATGISQPGRAPAARGRDGPAGSCPHSPSGTTRAPAAAARPRARSRPGLRGRRAA